MHDGSERLAQDVAVLSAMAEQMPQYLDSDILYWPAPRGGYAGVDAGRLFCCANSVCWRWVIWLTPTSGRRLIRP